MPLRRRTILIERGSPGADFGASPENTSFALAETIAGGPRPRLRGPGVRGPGQCPRRRPRRGPLDLTSTGRRIALARAMEVHSSVSRPEPSDRPLPAIAFPSARRRSPGGASTSGSCLFRAAFRQAIRGQRQTSDPLQFPDLRLNWLGRRGRRLWRSAGRHHRSHNHRRQPPDQQHITVRDGGNDRGQPAKQEAKRPVAICRPDP